jgi:hypothetical protein
MRLRSLIITCLASLIALGAFSASASAETTGPVWKIMAVSTPTNFKPGDESGVDAIVVTATNVGGAAAGCTQAQIEFEKQEEEEENRGSIKRHHRTGCPPGSPVTSPITITDSLPKGLTAVEVIGGNAYGVAVSTPGLEVVGPPRGLSCTLSATAPSCTTSERIDPGDTLIVTIRVHVESVLPPATCEMPAGAVDCLTNEASVSGGGVASASVGGAGGSPIVISSALPAYGVAKGGLLAASSTSQAGGHPNVTSAFFLNTINPAGESILKHGGAGPKLLASEPSASSKDVRFDLPPGLVGTTVGVARCTMAEVSDNANCPRDTMVGTATLIVFVAGALDERHTITVPVYNIAPSPGEPAAFAFNALYFPVRLDTSVLSDGEYNVRVTAPDITTGAADYFSSVTIWGDPAEHNGPGPDAAAKNLDGDAVLQIPFGGPGVEKIEVANEKNEIISEKRVPLLTNPSQCSTPLTGTLETDSWEAPGVFPSGPEYEAPMGTATGCGNLSFKPGVSMLPDTLEAGAPAGYAFDLSLPQNTEPESLATPDVKRTVVTLPAGTVISPSAANGLGDCSSEQFDLHSGVPGGCPRNSQVGTVRSKTPALEEALTGEVYLAAPQCTGVEGTCTPADAQDGRMIRLFLQLVGEGESGIVVKQELTGQINQQTGQLTVTDAEVPEVPFSDLKLTLAGGSRATLSNPRACGTVTTTADLTPWSTPFTPDGTPSSSFDVDENCFGSQFSPSFTGGTTSNQAGGFSPFTLSFGRGDADQFLNGAQIQMPPGLLGLISKVKLCEEPQANAGTCSSESQIGEVSVETGPGADPFLVTGGKVYITGPYKGAPYGLSIVVPAKAGPYTLSGTTGQGTVVNRSSINVNPITSALTVTSDPLPTELDGIPLQLRLVNVTVGTNNDFTFNPTSCEKMAVGGRLTSTQATAAGESSSFQVTNCAGLKFQPKFTATGNAHTSKANGASLLFKISYPSGVGTQAWLRTMKFDIPKQLPARLTTIQKACPSATFEANPAACPAASIIGSAKVHTPLLPVVVSGPVYFVSYGGAKFPEVVLVLQGDNVVVDLHGETFISKTGVTSATFKAVPDVPFETAEVFVPTGPFSEFAANGNLCKEKLVMPIAFTAQNGATFNQNTKIGVTGCPKAKKAAKPKKKHKKGKKASSKGRKSSIGQGGRS